VDASQAVLVGDASSAEACEALLNLGSGCAPAAFLPMRDGVAPCCAGVASLADGVPGVAGVAPPPATGVGNARELPFFVGLYGNLLDISVARKRMAAYARAKAA
jgi:hypothetical protein